MTTSEHSVSEPPWVGNLESILYKQVFPDIGKEGYDDEGMAPLISSFSQGAMSGSILAMTAMVHHGQHQPRHISAQDLVFNYPTNEL